VINVNLKIKTIPVKQVERQKKSLVELSSFLNEYFFMGLGFGHSVICPTV